MRITEAKVGARVLVTIGSGTRTAVIDSVYDGKIGVAFTDTAEIDIASIPTTHRSGLFGTTTHPRNVQPDTTTEV